MSDPTYDRVEIRKNPLWNAAFIMSEFLNDNAPIGWAKYIKIAEAIAQDAYINKPKRKKD